MASKPKEVQEMTTIPQAARELGVSRQAIWLAIKAGRIKAFRFGHVALIPPGALAEYQASKSKGGRPGKKKPA